MLARQKEQAFLRKSGRQQSMSITVSAAPDEEEDDEVILEHPDQKLFPRVATAGQPDSATQAGEEDGEVGEEPHIQLEFQPPTVAMPPTLKREDTRSGRDMTSAKPTLLSPTSGKRAELSSTAPGVVFIPGPTELTSQFTFTVDPVVREVTESILELSRLFPEKSDEGILAALLRRPRFREIPTGILSGLISMKTMTLKQMNVPPKESSCDVV